MAELPDKSSAFVDWYLEVVEAANLTDKRYGVKGLNVWTPYGFRARRELDARDRSGRSRRPRASPSSSRR